MVEVSYQLQKCDHLAQMSSPEKIYKPLIWNLSLQTKLSLSPLLANLALKSSLCCNKTMADSQKYMHELSLHKKSYTLPQP